MTFSTPVFFRESDVIDGKLAEIEGCEEGNLRENGNFAENSKLYY